MLLHDSRVTRIDAEFRRLPENRAAPPTLDPL
jgi:hypothetical protein